jgi:hypothetical protein
VRAGTKRAPRPAPAPAPTRRPLLLTGCHRSGTGWVGQVIAAAPEPIGYVWEPFSLRHRPGTCAVRFPYWFPYVTAENEDRYRPAIAAMLDWRYSVRAELAAVRTPKDVARLGRDWAMFQRNRRRRATPLLKDPIALLSAEWLASRFEMDVVVLIRHPAAFTASLKRLHWTHPFDHFLRQPALMRDMLPAYAEDIERFAAQEQDIVDQGILLWNILHDVIAGYQDRHSDWLFARLEDLSLRPVEGFRELFARLGLDYTDEVDALVRRTSASSNPAEASRLDSVHRDSARHVSNWKRTLEPVEVERVRTHTEPIWRRFYRDEDW